MTNEYEEALEWFNRGWAQNTNREADAIRRALIIAANQAPQWLPIETAPKDETSVLLYVKHKTDNGYSVVQGSWFEAQFYADSKEHIIDWEDGLIATHWMPLPTPPAQEKIDE